MMKRAIAALGVAAIMVLAVRGVLLAHATLVSSEPAARARLASAPARIRLLFDEEIEPLLARVEIVSTAGTRTSLAIAGDPHDVHAIVAPVSDLGTGAYEIVWRVVSADGHPVDGAIPFTVGSSTSASVGTGAPTIDPDSLASASWGPTVAGAPIIPSILRGLGLAALMAVTGLLYFERAARPTRTVIAMALAAAILLVLHFAAWMMNAAPDHALTGATVSEMSGTLVGKVEIVRTALAVLVYWALGLARRPKLALVFAVLALIASGGGGHAAGIRPAIAIPAKAIHLLAAAIWLGGLLYLMRVRGDNARVFEAEALHVSGSALGAVLLVLASGVVQTLLFVSPLDGVLHSAYGAVTLLKVAGLLVLIAFGAYHRYRVIPRISSGGAGFAASLRAEAAVMLLVILLGGLLAYVPTPHST